MNNLDDNTKTARIFGVENRIARLRQDALDRALVAAEGADVDSNFEGTGWEYLLQHVLTDLFRVRVVHTGGANERGADLVVRLQQPFSDEVLLMVIQVKHHSGNTGTDGIDQLRTAIRTRKSEGTVCLAVLATTGIESETLCKTAKNLETETNVKVVVCAADNLQKLVRRGLLLSALKDDSVEPEPEPK